VLIVDDHEGFRSLARAVLEADGFEVVAEAADAAGTMPAVEEARPDIVLLDIQLPDGSGFDLADEIRRLSGGPVVVLVSTREAADFGSRIGASGARGFIPKSRLSGAALAAIVS
jgi:DNA-binding NarL/FixJ family response regulator